jgi:hypothetical protein
MAICTLLSAAYLVFNDPIAACFISPSKIHLDSVCFPLRWYFSDFGVSFLSEIYPFQEEVSVALTRFI